MKINLVDRSFVCRRIDDFVSRWNRGYFTLSASPGAGKSVILSQYAADNPHVIYYNAQLPENNRADKFLRGICTQLLEKLGESDELPDNVTEGSWFLSQLLQRISDSGHGRSNTLIIAIDGCERIDLRYQSPGSNLFYLPRYLPDNIYFLLSRRPFSKDKSGLLTESPRQSLDLREYPKENREDIRTYVERYFASCAVIDQAKSEKIIANSDGNFMYVSQLLADIHKDSLFPSDLVSYYQSHLKKMQISGLLGARLKLLRLLSQESKFLPAKKMATAINEDKFDVEMALEDWREFLVEQLVDAQPFYRLYHHHFQEWLLTEIGE